MIRLLILFTILTQINTSYAIAQKNSKNTRPQLSYWQLKRHYGDTSIYTSKNKVRLTVAYSTTSPIKKKNFSNQLLKKLQYNKKRMLASIGIKNWKVHKSQIKKLKRQTYIQLSGSYLDLSGQSIQFVEHHFYRNSRYLQILLTHANREILIKDAKLAKVREFRARYGF